MEVTPTRLARLPRDKREFSTAEAFHWIEEVAALEVPLLALTDEHEAVFSKLHEASKSVSVSDQVVQRAALAALSVGQRMRESHGRTRKSEPEEKDSNQE